MDICIIVFRTHGVEDIVVESCYNILSKIFVNSKVELFKELISIPHHFYNLSRSQYIADGIVYMISELSRLDCFNILLANVDAYVNGLNFVFGLAIPWLKSAAVFVYRLRLDTDFSNYVYRVQKEVLHELGHLLGLNHCKVSDCVMNFSNSVYDVDKKSHRYCNKCLKKLSRKNIKISV